MPPGGGRALARPGLLAGWRGFPPGEEPLSRPLSAPLWPSRGLPQGKREASERQKRRRRRLPLFSRAAASSLPTQPARCQSSRELPGASGWLLKRRRGRGERRRRRRRSDSEAHDLAPVYTRASRTRRAHVSPLPCPAFKRSFSVGRNAAGARPSSPCDPACPPGPTSLRRPPASSKFKSEALEGTAGVVVCFLLGWACSPTRRSGAAVIKSSRL